MRAPPSVRKWKDVMRFEIRYFFLEVGLSPSGQLVELKSFVKRVVNLGQLIKVVASY